MKIVKGQVEGGTRLAEWGCRRGVAQRNQDKIKCRRVRFAAGDGNNLKLFSFEP